MNARPAFRPGALAFALALFAAPAMAQQPAPPRPATPAPAAPAPAAPAPPDTIPIPAATPAHFAAAREIVMGSGITRSFEGAIFDMMRQVNGTVTRTRPELVNDMKATLEKLQPEMLKLTEDMIVNTARIYTALMNEQECKDLAAFFKSPLGKKYIDAQPVVFANISDVMEPWRKHLSERIYEMVRDEMKKKGHQR